MPPTFCFEMYRGEECDPTSYLPLSNTSLYASSVSPLLLNSQLCWVQQSGVVCSLTISEVRVGSLEILGYKF